MKGTLGGALSFCHQPLIINAGNKALLVRVAYSTPVNRPIGRGDIIAFIVT